METRQLTQNVGHLVFKVLCSHKGVEEFLAAFDHGVDLATASSKVWVIVECIPQVVNRLVSGLSSCVDENADFRLRGQSDRITGSEGHEEHTLRCFPIPLNNHR